jgi:hypothetical protein
MADNVKTPDHYTAGGIETIDFIRAKLGAGFPSYCIGNVIKYVSRYDKKGAPEEDLKKARMYLDWAIEAIEQESGRAEVAKFLRSLP